MRAIHDQTRALLIMNVIFITRLWRALHALQRTFTSMISLNSCESTRERLVSGISIILILPCSTVLKMEITISVLSAPVVLTLCFCKGQACMRLLYVLLASSLPAAVMAGFAKPQAQHCPKLWNPSDRRTEGVFRATVYCSGMTIVAPVAVLVFISSHSYENCALFPRFGYTHHSPVLIIIRTLSS